MRLMLRAGSSGRPRRRPRTDVDHTAAPRTDGVETPATWLLHGGRPTSRFLIRRRYRIRLHGAEHLPKDGPAIVAANHVGIVDGPLMAIFSPRPVHALTKVEMFEGRTGLVLRLSGQIPLDRFATDPRAVKTTLRLLREGHVVGIFPEGGRGAGELELFHRGAAYLALVTGAPIVPLMMIGTREPGGSLSSLPGRKAEIDMVYGEPFTVDPMPWPRTQDAVADVSTRLRERMLADLEEAKRLTGRSLPGPLPAGQQEPDPGGGVTEKSA
ncbi:hypothetical protein GCM10023340_43560 [Nocardioides marinquilinus]|uniref:Phospholipid/glycerol acyltransferase domain-containing protein n=2 Tax=Nocardioides marinquilinus TaxID=1210400 RepID=A0ABP9Q3G1_9ACTN